MKKKVLFFTTPAYGHINSALPIVERLVNKDYQVICYSSKEYKQIIEETGAKYIEYKIDFNVQEIGAYTSNFVELLKALTKLNHEAYEHYVNSIDYTKYDLVVYDSMCAFAKNIAYKKKIKSICIETTLAYNFFVFIFSNMFWNSIKTFGKNLKELLKNIKSEKVFRKKYNLSKLKIIDLFVNSGDKTIVLTPKEFQPFYKTFNKNFCFVGTTIKERLQKQNKNYKRYNYFIALGSVLKIDEKLLNEILNIEQLKESKTALLIDKRIENFDTYKFVEQLSFLKNVDIFINHGGLNSVYESIYLNKKQICIPMQEEQRFNALICKHKKIGGYVKKYTGLGKQLKEIEKWNKNSEKYSKIFKSYDGTKLAYEIIDKYIKEGF